jgi:hypothetical protein
MALVQDDHMVQTFTADTPNQALDVRILPRTPWGNHDFFDPHMLYPRPKGSAIDAVPVAQEIPRGLVPWEGINDLLSGPFRGGMLGDIDVDEAPSMMAVSEAAPDTSPRLTSPGRSPASAVPPRSGESPTSDSPATCLRSADAPPWQWPSGRACLAGSSLSNGRESVAVAKQGSCGVGQTGPVV